MSDRKGTPALRAAIATGAPCPVTTEQARELAQIDEALARDLGVTPPVEALKYGATIQNVIDHRNGNGWVVLWGNLEWRANIGRWVEVEPGGYYSSEPDALAALNSAPPPPGWTPPAVYIGNENHNEPVATSAFEAQLRGSILLPLIKDAIRAHADEWAKQIAEDIVRRMEP